MKKIRKVILIVCCYTILFLSFLPAWANEVKNVDKVDNRKIIKVIDKNNVDEVKDLLPPTTYLRVKEWGLTFNIVPTLLNFRPHKGYIEATKKYKGQCKIGPKGNLLNYVAGCPFPDPKTADEVAWNFHERYYGDDRDYHSFTGHIIDRKGKERIAKNHGSTLKYYGRVNLSPKPVIPNKEGLEFKEIMMQDFPFEAKGLGLLCYRYADGDRTDDNWLYIPSLRRVRRFSSAQRGDHISGTDTTWDDSYSWCGKMERNTYKMVGKTEILHPFHEQKDIWPEWPEKLVPFCQGGNYEKIPVIVIDAFSKDPNYVYPHRRWWIDTHTWDIAYQEMWDKKGKLWKSVALRFYIHENVRYCHTFEQTDYQNRHATIWEVKGFTLDLNPPRSDFDVNNLVKHAR